MYLTRAARSVLTVSTVVLGLACTTSAVLAAAPEYFKLPEGIHTEAGISVGSDGMVWFAANQPGAKPKPAPGIGRLDPAQASPGSTSGIGVFPTPTLTTPSCCANAVRSVAVDSTNRRVWFVQNEGIVGFANPDAVNPGSSSGMVAIQLPGLQDLWDIAVAPNGLAWFTEWGASNIAPQYYGNRIATIDSGLNVTELENLALQGNKSTLDSLRYDAKPAGITTDANGTPWFAEADPGNPGYRIATVSGTRQYNEYPITPCEGSPCSGSYNGTGPTDVAVAHDGSIWFTNEIKNQVGRLDVSGGTFTSYSLPAIDHDLAGGQARAISVAPDGTLWVAEFGSYSHPAANAIIGIVPSQPDPTATVYKLGVEHTPFAVAPDTRGNVWFATDSSIGRLAGVIGTASTPETGGKTDETGGKTGTTTPATPNTGPPSVTLRPASVGVARVGSPQASGGSVKVDQICVGPPSDPCSLVYLLSSAEYVTGFPGSKASAARAKKKVKGVVLGRKAVMLHGGEHRKITVSLNAAGKKLLKRKGKLTLFFTVTQAGATGSSPKVLERVKVTLRAKH